MQLGMPNSQILSHHFAHQVPLNKRRFQGIVEEQDEFTPAQLLEMLADQNMQVGQQERCCFLVSKSL